MQKIIFTDLDGTLLDYDTYSFRKARRALGVIKRKKVPLVICTSKTRSENEFFRKKLGITHPFISENGGAIFIPKGYFNFKIKYNTADKSYIIIWLGTDYPKTIKVYKRIKEKYNIRGFSDMCAREIAEISGLSTGAARLAKMREFDEPFIIDDNRQEKAIVREIRRCGFKHAKGGRFHHITNSDKGRAIRILTKHFKRKFGKIVTIGFGDSKNDFEMLDNVDIPYLVMKKNRKYACKKYKKAGAIGPEGWNMAALKELQDD